MSSDRGEALAMGDVVNTASRLQSAAPTGRVIVGRETHRATRHAIRYESSPAIDAKGKAEPVEAWLAVEPSTAPAERPLASTALVGRDRELELMASVWTRALSERRPHLVTVIGPPGRRLAEEFCADGVCPTAGKPATKRFRSSCGMPVGSLRRIPPWSPARSSSEPCTTSSPSPRRRRRLAS
ncbi:MAG: hypothetical protein AUI83_21140 [Armatimonadetes bacterium 13_1_40CM_3_65_7]|nr:MAG: hypothetical protein AUI83_21140 [Armatimonadetes bacterium 13_1_40CM_3_65_7]